jgi:hypothetical protein
VSEPADAEASYSLEMPFVACRSQGGAYDDDAFVAGWRLGTLYRELSTLFISAGVCGGEAIHRAVIRPAEVAQVDLIAMRYRATVEAWPWPEAPEEWVVVEIKRRLDPAPDS